MGFDFGAGGQFGELGIGKGIGTCINITNEYLSPKNHYLSDDLKIRSAQVLEIIPPLVLLAVITTDGPGIGIAAGIPVATLLQEFNETLTNRTSA